MSAEAIDDLTDDDLAALSDKKLRDLAGDAILATAVMAGSRWAGEYHDRCDRVYAECRRRGRGIYQRAFNDVARSQGHSSMVGPVTEGTA